MDIPSMHDQRLPPLLRKYAAFVPAYYSIVEVGTWLGASAHHLLDASTENVPVHLYDRWKANGQEVQKALIKGEERLQIGKVYEDVVRENLSGFGDRVVYHLTEDIRHAVYSAKEPIGLYVDDASKNQIDKVFPHFETRMVYGTTFLAFMDWGHAGSDKLRAYIEAHGDLKFVEKGFGTAIYRYG